MGGWWTVSGVHEQKPDVDKLLSLGGVEGLASPTYVDSNLRRGINSSTLEERKNKFGDNVLPQKELMSFFEHVMDALGDTMMLILIGAAVVSLVLGPHHCLRPPPTPRLWNVWSGLGG